MKKLFLFSVVCTLLCYTTYAQTIEFSDDFESGAGNWVLTGTWGLTNAQSYSPTNSLADSPGGNYGNNVTSFATMATGVDLSTVPSAGLTFWAIYDIEGGFDYMYVDVSIDDFVTFTNIAVFDGYGFLTPWVQYNYDLGGFCGNSNVKVRFRFETDGAAIGDGMYIDDFEITSSLVDSSPPLIVHIPLPFYEGSLGDHTITADIVDFSGVNDTLTKLYYIVDGGGIDTVDCIPPIVGDEYTFIIPQQSPGAWVEYLIYSEDNYITPNSIETDTFEYIAGNHLIYDNGVVDFLTVIEPAAGVNGVSVRVTLGNTDLAAILIRNYTDVGNPNDSIEIHVWNDSLGLPGADVITPFIVFPEATLTNTSPMTRIDLRSYSAQLSGLNGDYFIGFIVPTGKANITLTQPGLFGRSFFYDGIDWTYTPDDDYHFRAVTAAFTDIEGPFIVNNNAPVFYEGTLDAADTVIATITDMSGVQSAELIYTVDGGIEQFVNPFNITGDDYSFEIPAQTAGAMVNYWINATDSVIPVPYTSETDTFRYIAGNYIAYDNAQIDFYTEIDPGAGVEGASVRVSIGGTADLVSILIRNYYIDVITTPNDDMEIHVWDDAAGLPGADLIAPFTVSSLASSIDNSAMTPVDLRPYSATLSNLTGDIFIGFIIPVGKTAITITQPGSFGRSYVFDGIDWINDAASDYHLRAITTDILVGTEKIISDNIIAIYPNPCNSEFNFIIKGEDNEDVSIRIYDIVGKNVFYKEINSTTGTLNISHLDKGIYIARIQKGDKFYQEKLIIQ